MSTSDHGNRKNSRGWKPYAVGAAVVAALLASTACESDEANGTGGHRASDESTATSPAKPGGTSAGSGDNSGSGSGKNGDSGDKGGNSDAARKDAPAACTEDVLAVSATKEPADSKDARHLLITVQNTGGEKCDLYHYPHVALGDQDQPPAPVIKESAPDPDAPVTLAPGKEAYAALLVSGGARDEYRTKTVTLRLHDRKPGTGKTGKPMDVPLPVDTLYADDGQLVTYWSTASGYVLDFITSK